MDAVGGGKRAGHLDAIALDVGHGAAEHPRQLAGVWRETARRWRSAERVEVTGERRQRVGVEHQRTAKIVSELAGERLSFGVEPEPRPHHGSVTGLGQLVEGLASLEPDRA